MPDTSLEYTKSWLSEEDFPHLGFSRNWESPIDYPTYEPDEAVVRKDMQSLHDETKDYINNELIPAVVESNSTEAYRNAMEAERQGDEQVRKQAETAREEAEQARKQAEQARVDETTGVVAQATRNAKSWAVGGTSTREGEDTNNAKYWSDKAQEAKASAAESKAAAAASEAAAKGASFSAESFAAEAQTSKDAAAASASSAKKSQESASSSATVASREAAVAIGAAEAAANCWSRADDAAKDAEMLSESTPYIGSNGNWFEFDTGSRRFVDSGKAAQGVSGVYVGSGEMPEGYNVQIDPDGTILHGGYYTVAVEQISESTMRVSYTPSETNMPAVASETVNLPRGPKPVKGTDYWTATDKKEIVNDVLSALPVYAGEVEGA